jgi:hypothetical protein
MENEITIDGQRYAIVEHVNGTGTVDRSLILQPIGRQRYEEWHNVTSWPARVEDVTIHDQRYRFMRAIGV